MRTMLCSLTLSVAAAIASTAAAAVADTVAFIGPAGWSHSPPAPSTDPNRTVDQWTLSGDIATVTFVKDTSTAYADALGTVEKNFSTNKIKPAVDRDIPCRGTIAHVVELTYGPDGSKIVVNRIIVPDGTGVDTITYARSDGEVFDTDVKKAETAFCAVPAP